MSIVSAALKRPVTTIAAVLALVLLGSVSLGRLPVSLLPDVTLPVLTIRTLYPGAASTEASGPHNAGYSLSGDSGAVFLFNAVGQPVDVVNYGFQIQDQPIGRNGADWQLLSTATPGAPNSAAALLGSVNNLRFNEWLADVAVKRGMSFEQAESLAHGRVWTGTQALENGLVDAVGGFDAALALAREKADLEPDAKVRLVHYPEAPGLLDFIESGNASGAVSWLAYRYLREDLAETWRLIMEQGVLGEGAVAVPR